MDTSLQRPWWGLLVSGLAGVVFGVLLLAWPGLTLATLILLFGIYAIAFGAFYAIASLFDRTSSRWGGFLAGLAGVAAGVLVLVWPDITGLTLLYVIASFAIAAGVFELVAAFTGERTTAGRVGLALLGLVSVGFGVYFFARPLSGALVLLTTIGIFAIVTGVLQAAQAFLVRGEQKKAAAAPALEEDVERRRAA